jgi:hypothetical protein
MVVPYETASMPALFLRKLEDPFFNSPICSFIPSRHSGHIPWEGIPFNLGQISISLKPSGLSHHAQTTLTSSVSDFMLFIFPFPHIERIGRPEGRPE